MMPPLLSDLPGSTPERRAAVQRLHRSAPVIDGRCDAVQDGCARACRTEAPAARRVDVSRVLRQGTGGLVFALGVRPSQYGGPAHAILRQYETLMRELEASPGQAAMCTSSAAIEQAHAAGKLAAILSLEGGEALEGDLDLLHTYYHLGVRIIGPVRCRSNELGGGACDDPEPSGLTPFGRQVVREMAGLGIIADTAHLPEHGFRDALECADGRPVICSCAGVRGALDTGQDSPRTLADDQIRALAATGGVLGIDMSQRGPTDAGAILPETVRSFRHAADLVGAEHVGFAGCCGGARPGAGAGDAGTVPRLTSALLDAGFAERELLGILGGNFLRVFREVWKS